MTATKRFHPPSREFEALLALMDEWPTSWAGGPRDEAIGQDLVVLMRPFFLQLCERQFSAKTLGRHLDNLWLIGGEIIRDVNDDATLRRKPARALLLNAIDGGEAVFIADLSEDQERSLHATANKLFQFITASKTSRP